MSQIRKPICFIAMAFGRDDTDAFYKNLVLPILLRNDITPVIINGRQSNDDINFQIFKQLREADFCIADLTYTRPSVYFEAGFAEREIPVIYTVRKDHLDRAQPDDLRVHFDLQMKPLIDWKTPGDKTFPKRLELRIKSTFLVDWARKQKAKQKDEEAEIIFSSLPVSERFKRLRNEVILELTKLGYDKPTWTAIGLEKFGIQDFKSIKSQANIINGQFDYVYGYKVLKNKLYVSPLQSFSSVTKKDLQRLELFYTSDWFLSNDIRELIHERKIKNIFITVFILSLGILPSSRIENALPYFQPIEAPKRYFAHVIHNEGSQYAKEYITEADFRFLAGIKSIPAFKKQLQEQLVDPP